VIAQTCEKSNPNYDLLQENLAILKFACDAKGCQLDILEMDVIPYATAANGTVCAVPYTNAYVVNGVSLHPKLIQSWTTGAFQSCNRPFRDARFPPAAANGRLWAAAVSVA
jgi:agmatine/peptidylarginine deiminase